MFAQYMCWLRDDMLLIVTVSVEGFGRVRVHVRQVTLVLWNVLVVDADSSVLWLDDAVVVLVVVMVANMQVYQLVHDDSVHQQH